MYNMLYATPFLFLPFKPELNSNSIQNWILIKVHYEA